MVYVLVYSPNVLDMTSIHIDLSFFIWKPIVALNGSPLVTGLVYIDFTKLPSIIYSSFFTFHFSSQLLLSSCQRCIDY